MSAGIIKAVDFKKGLGYLMDDNGREIVLVALGLEDAIALARRSGSM